MAMTGATCVQCHTSEAAGYGRTGMAHAFSRPMAKDTVASPAKDRQFYHAASGTYYELTEHNGSYYQRRWQKGFGGSPENVEELTIDFIMGSGNHARTYLHREQDGTLIELPMAWYASNDCVSCHMPKHRTEDVVHAVMTDHLIQRQPPSAKELVAERQEVPDTPANAYRGPVKRYLLDHESPAAADPLYDAAAQVIDGSNLEEGIPQLSDLIKTQRPAQPNFSIEPGDAMRHTGDLSGAIDAYRHALSLDPLSSRAQRRLGVALGSAGQVSEAAAVLRTAIEREPRNALLWYEQAQIESRSGNSDKAIADLRKALELKPDFADAQNNLGSVLAQSGDLHGAETAFHAALTINPYDSGTRANLGRLLARESDWKQAAFHLQKAVPLDQSNASAHGDYAVALLQMQCLPEAEAEAKASVASDSKSPRAHDFPGEILAQRGTFAPARTEFERALGLNQNFGPAQLDLAQVLLQQGQTQAAVALLEKAEHSSEPEIAAHAHTVLQQLGPR